MSGFDPYYKWLAIPPAEQPPNHYRLLGLVLFESDADVISAAADRQMAHVRTFQNGPHRQHSQQLLNEIALARVTLLNADQKTQYDAKLRVHQGSNGAAKPLPVARTLEAAPAAPRPAPRPAPMPGRAPLPASSVEHATAPASIPAQATVAVAPAPTAAGHPQPQIPAIPASALASAATVTRQAPLGQPPEAAEGRPVRRFSRQQLALFWTIFGVVGGGLMGTYLAGVILNVLGADIPDSVRFLPGLGSREVVVAPGDDPNKSDPNNDPDSGRHEGNNNQVDSPEHVMDPWKGILTNGAPQHVGPGFVRLLFVQEGTQSYIGIERTDQLPWGSAAVHKTRAMAPMAFKRSPEIQVGHDPDRGLFLTVAPGQTGKLLLALRGLGPMVFTGQAKTSFAADIAGGRIEVEIHDDIDPRTFLPRGQSLRAQSTARVDGLIQVATQVQNTSTLNVLVTLTANANGPLDGVRLYLQSDHGSNTRLSSREFASVQLTLPQGGPNVRPPIPGQNRPPTVAPNQGAELAQQLRLQQMGPLDAKHERRLTGAELAARFGELERRIGGADPRPYLAEGENASNDWDTRFAALTVAARKAVAIHDVVLAAEAYDRLNRWFEGDFAAEEAASLQAIYRANPAGFQPPAFAAWSIDVLKRLNAEGKLAEHGELVKLAVLTARESGDRDLIHEAAAIASQLSAPSN